MKRHEACGHGECAWQDNCIYPDGVRPSEKRDTAAKAASVHDACENGDHSACAFPWDFEHLQERYLAVVEDRDLWKRLYFKLEAEREEVTDD